MVDYVRSLEQTDLMIKVSINCIDEKKDNSNSNSWNEYW